MTRPPEDQVQAYPLESNLLGRDDCTFRIRCFMHPPKSAQSPPISSLQTNTQAVDSCVMQASEIFRRQAIGICFERDFGIAGNIEPVPRLIQNRPDLVSTQQ